jgi:hypothetical protein
MKLKLAHGIPMLALAAAVQNANAAITVANDIASTGVNTSVQINVLANDSTTQSGSVTLFGWDQESGYGGSISSTGYGGLVYFPPDGFEGVDTFTYQAYDGVDYGSAVVTVYVGVSAPSDEGELESAVTGRNNKKTARMLDNLCEKVQNQQTDGISQDIIAACGDLSGADRGDLNDIISQITPEEILVLRHMMSNISQSHSQRVYQHQDALRANRSNNMAFNGNTLLLQSYRGGAAGGEQNSRWGMFGSVHVDNAEHDQTEFESEYEMTGMGATVGVDYRLSPNLFVGGAVDWSTYEVDYASNGGTVDADVYNVTGFLTWYIDQFSLDVQMGYGSGDFDTERNITFPTASVASGSTSSDQYNLSVQADWTYAMNALTLRPYLRVDYMTTEIDGYEESSGGPWAMQVGSQDVDQVTSSLGLDTTYSMGFNWGVFVPGLKIAAVSESSSDYSPVTFQLVGVTTPDGAFELQPDTEDSLFYQYDISGVFVLKNGWSTFLSGQFISGYDNFSTYIVSGGVRMEL